MLLAAPCWTWPSQTIPSLSTLRNVKVAERRSNTPTSSRPSPSQSPATGRSLESPSLMLVTAPLAARSRNSPVEGVQTPTSSLPSPSQSPATGLSPALPKVIPVVHCLSPQEVKVDVAGVYNHELVVQ